MVEMIDRGSSEKRRRGGKMGSERKGVGKRDRVKEGEMEKNHQHLQLFPTARFVFIRMVVA